MLIAYACNLSTPEAEAGEKKMAAWNFYFK
jgi:hypothetical protein